MLSSSILCLSLGIYIGCVNASPSSLLAVNPFATKVSPKLHTLRKKPRIMISPGQSNIKKIKTVGSSDSLDSLDPSHQKDKPLDSIQNEKSNRLASYYATEMDTDHKKYGNFQDKVSDMLENYVNQLNPASLLDDELEIYDDRLSGYIASTLKDTSAESERILPMIQRLVSILPANDASHLYYSFEQYLELWGRDDAVQHNLENHINVAINGILFFLPQDVPSGPRQDFAFQLREYVEGFVGTNQRKSSIEKEKLLQIISPYLTLTQEEDLLDRIKRLDQLLDYKVENLHPSDAHLNTIMADLISRLIQVAKGPTLSDTIEVIKMNMKRPRINSEIDKSVEIQEGLKEKRRLSFYMAFKLGNPTSKYMEEVDSMYKKLVKSIPTEDVVLILDDFETNFALFLSKILSKDKVVAEEKLAQLKSLLPFLSNLNAAKAYQSLRDFYENENLKTSSKQKIGNKPQEEATRLLASIQEIVPTEVMNELKLFSEKHPQNVFITNQIGQNPDFIKLLEKMNQVLKVLRITSQKNLNPQNKKKILDLISRYHMFVSHTVQEKDGMPDASIRKVIRGMGSELLKNVPEERIEDVQELFRFYLGESTSA